MTTLEHVIENYNVIKEGGITHRRHFMNQKSSQRNTWYNRKRYAN
ncbi:hypothetical protein [Salinimicrobium sp. GXAS 041]